MEKLINYSPEKRFKEKEAPIQMIDTSDRSENFEFIIDETRAPLVISKRRLGDIIKMQALIRGFLARRLSRNTLPRVLYNRILRRDNTLVRFVLIKNTQSSYTLTAKLQAKRKFSMSI